MKDRFMRLVAMFLRPFMRWIFAYDIRGLENLPAHGPFLLASNHISYIDAIVVIDVGMHFTQPPFYLRFLSKAELFGKQPLRWIMRQAGQIPVARGTSQAGDSLIWARQALDEGEAIAIFPEGTISLTLLPMKPHTGIGRLALEAGVPVVPVGIWGTHRTWGKFHKREFRHHRPVTIDIGEPLTYSEGTPAGTSGEIMSRIVELVDSARRRYPEQPGPDDWWGPPEWPRERAGRWRPRISRDMSEVEQLARAHEAMMRERA